MVVLGSGASATTMSISRLPGSQGIAIGSVTVAPQASAVTVSDVAVSFGTGGLVVDSSTVSVSSQESGQATSTPGMGGLINSGIDGHVPSMSNTTGSTSTATGPTSSRAGLEPTKSDAVGRSIRWTVLLGVPLGFLVLRLAYI